MKIEVVKDFSAVQSTILVVGVHKHIDNLAKWEQFEQSFNTHTLKWIRSKDIATGFKEITILPTMDSSNYDKVMFVGLDNPKKLTNDKLRHLMAAVGQSLRKIKASSVAIWADPFVNENVTDKTVARLAGEGIMLGSYQFEGYKTTSNEVDFLLEQVTFISDTDVETLAEEIDLGFIQAHAVNEARTLVNLPPNILTAMELANYAKQLGEENSFEVEILGKKEMEELGMGAILAVNKGSVEEPQLIVLKYKGKEEWEDVLGLVGKGITYDTGGYSLKPRDSMVGMKGDMGGAAAVLGAMSIIGARKPKQNVIAVIASTDNMVSGQAFKPDDVITSLSGKTIEVLNTDAEGRLVLADAVTYALQSGASKLIDVATLTGGVIVALGNDKTGALTNDEAFFAEFMEATIETGEFTWRLPLTENDKKRIRTSAVADLNNSPGRDGHMIFGGGFVGEFAGDTPWIHLDIAGTSDAANAHDLGPKGGTGVMVRTLAQFVLNQAQCK